MKIITMTIECVLDETMTFRFKPIGGVSRRKVASIVRYYSLYQLTSLGFYTKYDFCVNIVFDIPT